jgi:membrane fusion protein, copper/silver efflux system
MFNRIKKIFLFVFVLALSFTAFSFSQEKTDSTMNHNNMKMMEHKNMMNYTMQMQNDSDKVMKMDTSKTVKDSIVREGIIDLKTIDKNKDGKVFQDMMDYNVISDEPGTCPLCGMTLKEVSLKKAKETLLKSGFKVKK